MRGGREGGTLKSEDFILGNCNFGFVCGILHSSREVVNIY